MFGRNKYILTLTEEKLNLLIESLIEMKNSLIREGKHTDAVDDALIKILKQV